MDGKRGFTEWAKTQSVQCIPSGPNLILCRRWALCPKRNKPDVFQNALDFPSRYSLTLQFEKNENDQLKIETCMVVPDFTENFLNAVYLLPEVFRTRKTIL